MGRIGWALVGAVLTMTGQAIGNDWVTTDNQGTQTYLYDYGGGLYQWTNNLGQSGTGFAVPLNQEHPCP